MIRLFFLLLASHSTPAMQIATAQFLQSNSDVARCPAGNRPEYAFIGRSNVGKSSLINMLCDRTALAKVSGTPGKTQLINHFLINDAWLLVDLPGYGYAKVGKQEREKLRRIITDYILRREQLTLLFVLVDSRHEAQAIDLEFMRFLGENGIPFAIIFTKTDKLRHGELERNIDAYRRRMLDEWEELPPMFPTSAEHRSGRDALLDYIDQINQTLS